MNASVKPIPPTGKKDKKSSITMLKSSSVKENKEERSLIASLGRHRTLCISNCLLILIPPASPKLQMSKITAKYIECHLHRKPKETEQRKLKFEDLREVS